MTADFAEEVRRQSEKLLTTRYHLLERDVVQKRVDWVNKRYPPSARAGTFTPRRLYEIFLLEYLGLAKADVPILSETEDHIIWDSRNRCPTLEACKRLGLDSRKICRLIYEKPVQALLSQFDPQLRFYQIGRAHV